MKYFYSDPLASKSKRFHKHSPGSWDSKYAISELPCASVSKRDFVQNLCYENEFPLQGGLIFT